MRWAMRITDLRDILIALAVLAFLALGVPEAKADGPIGGPIPSTAVVYLDQFASAMSTGTPADCSHDSTPAFTAAKAALHTTGGGTIVLTPHVNGCWLGNWGLGAGDSGIQILGVGNSSLVTLPTENYLQPFNNSLPALKIGDTTANVTANTVSGLQVNVNGDNYGIEFVDGANNDSLYNVSCQAAEVWCVKFLSNFTNSLAITYIRWFGGTIDIGGSNTGDALVSEGDGSGFANGISFNGVNFETNGLGRAIRAIGTTQIGFNGGYLQAAGPASGLSIEKSQSNSNAPALSFNGFPLDNSGGSTVVTVENQFGDPSIANVGGPQVPTLAGATVAGLSLYDAATTTGTISGSSASLAVVSATGFIQGRTVIIQGAGASGGFCEETVSSISGTTVTLSGNCATGVTSAFVEVGSVRTSSLSNLTDTVQEVGGILLYSSGLATEIKGYSPFIPNGESSILFASNGLGNTFPFSTNNDVLFTDNSAFAIGQQNGSTPTVSTITRSGTTVTVTFTGSPSPEKVGDQISISGEKVAAGINGTWGIASYNGSNQVTYTSNVSGTVSAFSGTITVNLFKTPAFQFGNLYMPGDIYFTDENGNQTKTITQSSANGQFTIFSPDRTNGSIILATGTTSTTNLAAEVYNGTNILFSVNGDGALAFGNASANTSTPVLVMPYSGGSGCASQTPGTNQMYLCNGAGGTAGILWTKTVAGTVQQIQESGVVATSALQACGASTAGLRAQVSDSTVAPSGNFAATFSGSGGNIAPVYCDGTVWRIG